MFHHSYNDITTTITDATKLLQLWQQTITTTMATFNLCLLQVRFG